MTDTNSLIGFALAAVRRAKNFNCPGIPKAFQVAPEGRRNSPVVGILYHRTQFTVFDKTAALAAKLEFIAAIVYRPGHVRFHRNAVFDLADEVIKDRGHLLFLLCGR